jgi:FdhD protein
MPPDAPSRPSPRRSTTGPTTPAQVLVVDGAGTQRRPDRLVTEEPMEIRAHGPRERPRPVAVTMRTPGNDFELAAGFLLTEGIVDHAADIDEIAYCLAGAEEPQEYNVVTVRTRVPVADRLTERRHVAHAGCGLCGKTTLDAIEVRWEPVGHGPRVSPSVLADLPARLAARQSVFSATGGLHAAARFSADGELHAVREDVGRHNALDKLIGAAALAGELPCADDVLLLSGRAGFELVQKAAAAGFPIVAAVSAPSSLAVATAARFGITLAGFVRDGRCNVYTGGERIAGDLSGFATG